jgi:2-iminobutanoate/2-iminopropanoate deaminase
VAAALLIAAGRPPSSSKRAINPPGTAEGLPFSNGILVGNTLYVAGQEGLDNGKVRPGGIGPETQAALENIKKIVTAAGLEMADVVSVTVYIADLAEFGEMNKVYKTFFPEPRPARATVQVAALVGHARVEISAIAVKTR